MSGDGANQTVTSAEAKDVAGNTSSKTVTGISIDGSTASASGGHLIENNVLDGNTFIGVDVAGDSAVVRNNIIANTGGTSTANSASGIESGSRLTQMTKVHLSQDFAPNLRGEGILAVWSGSCSLPPRPRDCPDDRSLAGQVEQIRQTARPRDHCHVARDGVRWNELPDNGVDQEVDPSVDKV